MLLLRDMQVLLTDLFLKFHHQLRLLILMEFGIMLSKNTTTIQKNLLTGLMQFYLKHLNDVMI